MPQKGKREGRRSYLLLFKKPSGRPPLLSPGVSSGRHGRQALGPACGSRPGAAVSEASQPLLHLGLARAYLMAVDGEGMRDMGLGKRRLDIADARWRCLRGGRRQEGANKGKRRDYHFSACDAFCPLSKCRAYEATDGPERTCCQVGNFLPLLSAHGSPFLGCIRGVLGFLGSEFQ